MRIRETNVNWAYPDIEDHRSKLVQAEKGLAEHFNAGAIMPYTDQTPKEIPRYIATTKGGHSVLNIALSGATFVTAYDGDYVERWDLCQRYIQERCDSVHRMIDKLSGNKEAYTGLIVQIEYDVPGGDSLKMIKENIFRENSSLTQNMIDASCKMTFVVEENFFANIHLQNVRDLASGEYRDAGFIGVTIDVNDRYMANRDQNYVSDVNSFQEILRISDDLIENRLEKIIIEGEF